MKLQCGFLCMGTPSLSMILPISPAMFLLLFTAGGLEKFVENRYHYTKLQMDLPFNYDSKMQILFFGSVSWLDPGWNRALNDKMIQE
jgi:hypothetical protein